MYVVVEAGTPKPAFLSLSGPERAEFFAALAEGVSGLAASGVEPLGWGANDAAGGHDPEHDPEHDPAHGWFAVWQVPDGVAADAFLAGVASSVWYDYFQQSNVHGELRPIEAVVAELIAFAG